MEKNKIDQIIKKLNKVENTSNELPSNNNSTSSAKNKNETAMDNFIERQNTLLTVSLSFFPQYCAPKMDSTDTMEKINMFCMN